LRECLRGRAVLRGRRASSLGILRTKRKADAVASGRFGVVPLKKGAVFGFGRFWYPSGNTLSKFEYTYDVVGNIVT
jgi:hypothetical protein